MCEELRSAVCQLQHAKPFDRNFADLVGVANSRADLNDLSGDHVRDGMKVRLATYSIGTDSAGTEAIGFGYEPIS